MLPPERGIILTALLWSPVAGAGEAEVAWLVVMIARRKIASEVQHRHRDSTIARWQFEPLEERRLLAVATVTTLDDTVDFNDGVTSLREAIFAANTLSGADTIEFAPELTAAGPATILLTQGELAITDSLDDQRPRGGPADDRRLGERSDAG